MEAHLLHEPRCVSGKMRGHNWSSCRQTDKVTSSFVPPSLHTEERFSGSALTPRKTEIMWIELLQATLPETALILRQAEDSSPLPVSPQTAIL